MSAVFGPGDRVRCIKAWHDLLVVDRVYTIGGLRAEPEWYCDACGQCVPRMFDLMEFEHRRFQAWCACLFAPTWDDEVPQTVEEINELIGSAMK